jgi:hypothetical protein
MKTRTGIIILSISLVFWLLFLAATARAQTNNDLQLQVSNLTVQLAALQKLADSNPPPVLVAVTFSNNIPIATNAVDTTTVAGDVSAQLAEPLHLLFGNAPWVGKVIAWLSAVLLLLAPWQPRIKIFIADKFNEIATNASPDMDAWLMNLFSKPWYVAASLLLRFAGIPLPTKADLERNIALQNEVKAAAAKG